MDVWVESVLWKHPRSHALFRPHTSPDGQLILKRFARGCAYTHACVCGVCVDVRASSRGVNGSQLVGDVIARVFLFWIPPPSTHLVTTRHAVESHL